MIFSVGLPFERNVGIFGVHINSASHHVRGARSDTDLLKLLLIVYTYDCITATILASVSRSEENAVVTGLFLHLSFDSRSNRFPVFVRVCINRVVLRRPIIGFDIEINPYNCIPNCDSIMSLLTDPHHHHFLRFCQILYWS